jgi:hypothetical protein
MRFYTTSLFLLSQMLILKFDMVARPAVPYNHAVPVVGPIKIKVLQTSVVIQLSPVIANFDFTSINRLGPLG